MTWSHNRLLLLVSVLLVVSAAVFALGSVVEHRQGSESATESSGSHEEAESATGESPSEPGAESEEGGEPVAASEHHDESDEAIAGLDPESWPAVTAAIGASLLLAAGVYWRRSRRWLLAAAGFGVVFAAGDVRELVHQLDESRTAVATIAGVLIALHLAITLAAVAALARSRSTVSPALSSS